MNRLSEIVRTGFGGLLVPLAAVLVLALSGCAGCALEQVRPPVWDSPQTRQDSSLREQGLAVYRQAWQTVKYEYLDRTYNGQDWSRWERRYDSVIQSPDDAYVGIQTMLATLNDDYTRFLPPHDMSEQTMQIDSRVFGVGIQIMVKDKKLTVVSTLKETPAAEAGLEPNDVITHIEGEPSAGLSVSEAADRIRGEEGTYVNLTIRRGDRSFDVRVQRAEIKIKTVFTKSLPHKEIGYIRLNTFISENALLEMREAVSSMADKKALILDLRGNYGGLLNNAVDIADLFLSEGEIVSIVGRDNQKTRVMKASSGIEFDKPLVVLIDGGSASASEILSGALKDHKRATLIGTRTFGKGLVQKINPLMDGSGINITISRYLTPSGRDIDHKGIDPDIEVALTQEDLRKDRDPQLQAAIDYLVREERMTAKAAS